MSTVFEIIDWTIPIVAGNGVHVAEFDARVHVDITNDGEPSVSAISNIYIVDSVKAVDLLDTDSGLKPLGDLAVKALLASDEFKAEAIEHAGFFWQGRGANDPGGTWERLQW